MTRLDDFFTKPTELLHPRLRDWKVRLAEKGTSAALEVWRAETSLGLSQPEMNIQFNQSGKTQPLETLPWDDEINNGLIQQKIRAVNPDNEAIRFALGLRAAMRRAEREFGDGYFNGVLVDLLKDSDLTTHHAIEEVLNQVSVNSPLREGKAYTFCRELIADAISGRARELTQDLGYSQDEAKQILINALARYLDERFSISARRRLGWP